VAAVGPEVLEQIEGYVVVEALDGLNVVRTRWGALAPSDDLYFLATRFSRSLCQSQEAVGAGGGVCVSDGDRWVLDWR
jgi:hypothetical protein